jgi:hypothetical protein
MKKNLTLAAVAIIVLFTSCAAGRKMSYENKEAATAYTVTKTAVVVFQDKREAVLAGKEKPSFCGHSNSTLQIGYNIQTNSGRPLADEFAESVSKGYSNKGAATTSLLVNMHTALDSVMSVFKADGKERLIFFTMHKWESKATPLFSSIRYEQIYDLELNVYDKNGTLMANAATHDVVVNEGGLATSIKKMQSIADTVFKEQVLLLFNNEAVKKSLME